MHAQQGGRVSRTQIKRNFSPLDLHLWELPFHFVGPRAFVLTPRSRPVTGDAAIAHALVDFALRCTDCCSAASYETVSEKLLRRDRVASCDFYICVRSEVEGIVETHPLVAFGGVDCELWILEIRRALSPSSLWSASS